MRNISAWSERSDCGWTAFSSATSSSIRGSEPSLHAPERNGEQLDRPQELALGEALRLLGEAVAVLGGDRKRVGHVAKRLDDEQVPQVGREVLDERA